MPLIIVESLNKVKKYEEYTGYKVIATGGLFCDLSGDELSVDLETYEPNFQIIPGKEKCVARLKEMAKGQTLLIATDPDREGAAISAFVEKETRGLYKDAFRVEVRAITESGIKMALENAVPFSDVNEGIFNAFKGKKITDRLVGYLLSPKASRDLAIKGLFIDHLQAVALRLVIDRECEIRLHTETPHWLVTIRLALPDQDSNFIATHAAGRYDDRAEADMMMEKISGASYAKCKKVEKLTKETAPPAPFTTASLLVAASTQLGMTPEKTMSLAQQLFVAGLITYHRTASVRLNDDIVKDLRSLVAAVYGKECVPADPIRHVAKDGWTNSHEGIRPTNIFPIADARRLMAAEGLGGGELFALFELIWKRTIASQMSPAVYEITTADIEAGGEMFKAVDSVLLFGGFQRAYSAEDEGGMTGGDEHKIPFLSPDDLFAFRGEELVEEKVNVPSRYSEAGLIERLESLGVGRPSTYASILGSLSRKWHVEIKNGMFVPTELGEKVIDWVVDNYDWVLDYDVARLLEESIDQVEQGKVQWKDVVREVHGRMLFEKPSLELHSNEWESRKTHSLTEIAKAFDIPVTVLAKMKSEGMLKDVVEDTEVPWFILLGQIWKRADYATMMAKSLSEVEREKLVKDLSATLDDKAVKKLVKPKPIPPYEKYVKARYRNAKPGEKILMEDLLAEIKAKFHVRISDKVRERIKVLRQSARDEKRPKQ